MAVLTVGPGQQYQTIAAAIVASGDGDTINVSAGTYTNDTATIDTSITLQAIGGIVNLVETQALANQKGIFIVGDLSNAPNVIISGFTFSGAEAPAGNNGAGIRYQAGNLTLNDDVFTNNQDGILATPSVAGTGSITINSSEFASNGAGDGFSHNIYINDLARFAISNSYIHDAIGGHEIKSRAETNIITNNVIADNNGTSSYSINLPNGGNATISGNTIEQGQNGANPVMIAYGEEGNLHVGASFSINGNTFINDMTAHVPTAVWNAGSAIANLANDSFWGIGSSQVASGANSQTSDVFLTSRPSIHIPTATEVTIELFGSTSLVQSGGNYFMNPVSGGAGPELSYQGAPVTVGGIGAWTPLGAEATSTGYEVAWKNGSADQYTVWQTDASGHFVSSTAVLSGSSSTLESYETSFHQDLNGDGTIGVPGGGGISGTTIELFGSTSLVQSGGNYFMNPVSGGTGPELSYQGAPVTVGELGAWAPLGAEVTSTGYEVAWKNGSADQYTVWQTDASGHFVSSTAVLSGSSSTLEAYETSFHQDLNGDGTIGVPGGGGISGTTIESFGSTSLVQSGGNYFMNPVSGGTGPELSYQGAPVTVGELGAWTPLGAEATSTGYEVAWKNGGADQYTVWQTDASGHFVSSTAVLSGSSSTFEAYETSFHQDLNGDGTIGVPILANTTASSDWHFA